MTRPENTGPGRVVRLGGSAVEILESLYQHRLLTTSQAHTLHLPDAGVQTARRALGRLRANRLADRVGLPGGMGVWFLTARGILAAEAIPNRIETRRKQIPPEQAAGPLQAHTLGVNDIGIAFVKAARERGDECGAYAWRHEIAHPLDPPPGRKRPEQLIADAVLTYQHSLSFHYRFIELDRANRSVDDLAARLARYARLYHQRVTTKGAGGRSGKSVILWTELYPAFPTLLVVLAGRDRPALERRREALLTICSQHPDLQATPQVGLTVCLLEDLTEHGPFEPIFRTLGDPDAPVGWLGQLNSGEGSR